MRPARDAITDIPGIRVGQWTDRRAVTGCTVVLCPPGTVGGVDVRGAAPGTRETDLLRPGNLVEEVHAVVLAGGSAFGLDAASGVMRYLREQGVGFGLGKHLVPIVPAAILFDLGIGGDRAPGVEEGYRAAARASTGRVEEGSVGAGTGATVAKLAGRDRVLKGGLGTASERLDTGVVVAALVAVNAVGSIIDPETAEVVAAPRGDSPGEFLDVAAILRTGRRWRDPVAEGAPDAPPAADPALQAVNTTIGVVATNAALTKAQADRLATVAHDALARTTRPAHTRGDGDAIFALATGEVAIEPDWYGPVEAMATRALERAVLRGIRLATGLAGVPSAEEWRSGKVSVGPAKRRGGSG